MNNNITGATAALPGNTSRRFSPDDMTDTAADYEALRSSPALRDALQVISDAVTQRYVEHDRRALESQRRYRQGILITAWGGSLAVLGALGQLTFEQLGHPVWTEFAKHFEVAAIVLTVVGVVLGLWLSRLENWLLQRFKAEQLRLLKFRFVLDPRLWGTAEQRASWQSDLLAQRDAIEAVSKRDLEHQSERDVMPRLPSHAECACVDAAGLEDLLAYYQQKRLEPQRSYFVKAASRGSSFLDRPRLLPVFFFASVLMVAAHVIVEGTAEGEEAHRLGTVFVAASAALPVIWAGIRTWRSARESTRNVARSAARRDTLDELVRMIAQMNRADPAHLLCHLQLCEITLESDQREWLRLMREVEWYG